MIQKLKSKHLVCHGFLWWEVFLREQVKIFCTYSVPNFAEIIASPEDRLRMIRFGVKLAESSQPPSIFTKNFV